MPLAGSFKRAVVKLNERFSMLVPNIVSDQLYVYQCINGAAKYVEPNVPLVVWGSATNFQELTQQMQVHDDADDRAFQEYSAPFGSIGTRQRTNN